MISKIRKSKFLSIILVIACLLPMCSGTVSATQTTETKKVRVGYMLYDGYQNGAEGEAKSGSAYEYYQKLKGYTDWEYEYVYGSFNQMLTMLENGDIDIMSCVNYLEEREDKYLFSDEPHGTETYFLYTHKDNTEITPADLSTLNGKSVGVTKGSYHEQYFQEWCQEKGIDCNIVTYDYMEDMRAALTNKEIDAMMTVCIHTENTENIPWKSIYRFKTEDLYFAVSNSRPDLLKELNDAQAYITSTNEYYAYESMKKYHEGLNYHNVYLTPTQKAYVEKCGTLKVGYLEGTNPLAFTDKKTGEMSGLCAEYLDIMSESYGIKFDTQVYTDENKLIEDLRSEKLDIIFPLGMGYWSAEQMGIALSASICSLPMSAIYKEIGENNTFNKVVVNKNSPTQEGYVTQFYPHAEIYYVENTKEALEAVESGKADVYFVRSSSLEFLGQGYDVYDDFRTMSVRNDMEAFMAVRTEDTVLSIILDKGISLLTSAQRDSAKFRYTYEVEKTSLMEAAKDNIEIVIGLAIIVVLICIVLMVGSRLQANKMHMKKLVTERDKAEKAEHAKTEFLSQMSHDIRTPMNAIIGFTNIIKDEADIEIIKRNYVPKIEMASNQLLMLINDVLEMSRIDTGKLVFTRSVHDMEAIIESIVTVMRMQAEEKEIALTTDFCIRDRVVNCDRNQLSRVILNLVSNAVKFTPNGGSVKVSVYQQDEAPEGYAAYEIKVSDNGIGMAPEFLERVFEPFERERTSTVSGMQGTGLGMAIVKNIIDAAGDTITVESTLGKGTTFTMKVLLMLANEETVALHEEKVVKEKKYDVKDLKEYFKGKRILLVEDNEFNSMIAATILDNAGFLVETAENGKTAVHKVKNASAPDYYDAILMDIQMPIMNGYEAAQIIRNMDDERANVKIIAVTANAFEADKEKTKAAGMDGHVSKPLDVELLYQTLIDVTE